MYIVSCLYIDIYRYMLSVSFLKQKRGIPLFGGYCCAGLVDPDIKWVSMDNMISVSCTQCVRAPAWIVDALLMTYTKRRDKTKLTRSTKLINIRRLNENLKGGILIYKLWINNEGYSTNCKPAWLTQLRNQKEFVWTS